MVIRRGIKISIARLNSSAVYLPSALVYQEAWQSLDASVLTKYLFYRFLALHKEREGEYFLRIFFFCK